MKTKTQPSMENLRHAQFIAQNISQSRDAQARGLVMDASDLTAIFSRELEWVDNELMRTEFAPLKSELLVPYYPAGGPGVKTVTYRRVTEVGLAEFIAKGAKTLPRVDVVGDEVSVEVRALGDAYGYSIFDLMSIALNPTIKLDTEMKLAAFNAIKRLHDRTAMVGKSEFGWTGLINDANIPLITQAGSGTAWATSTYLEKVADILKLTWTIFSNCKELYEPDTLLLPTTLGTGMETPAGADAARTVASYILKECKFIKNIEYTHYLETANAAGTGPRIMAYKRDPSVARYGANEVFGEEPQQRDGFEIVTPCHGLSSGTQVRIPMACGYMDVD